MVPAWVVIICWAYLELLVITRTDQLWLVPPNYLFCGWICLHSCVTSLTLLFFFSHEKKISQILESLARKWSTLDPSGLTTLATWLMQRESITQNSNFSQLKLFYGPLLFELSKFHCIFSDTVVLEGGSQSTACGLFQTFAQLLVSEKNVLDEPFSSSVS